MQIAFSLHERINMLLKKPLMAAVTLTLLSAQIASACEIDDINIANLRSSNLIKVSELLTSPPRVSMRAAFVQDLNQCQHVRVISLRSKSSGQIYTAIASNEDHCDGGNTFGYVVKGASITTGSIIAMIQDSYIQCL